MRLRSRDRRNGNMYTYPLIYIRLQLSVAAKKSTKMATKWSPAGRAVRSEPFPLLRSVVRNGPEPSRARRCWARRSEPLTARTVLRGSLKRERRGERLAKGGPPFWYPRPPPLTNRRCRSRPWRRRWGWNNSVLPRVGNTMAGSQPVPKTITYTLAPALCSKLPLAARGFTRRRRDRALRRGEGGVGPAAHFENQRSAARRHRSMAEPDLVVELAVQHHRLHVLIRGRAALHLDHQSAILPEIERRFVEQWTAENIIAAGRIYGVKSQGADDVPGRHLPAVLISR